MEDIIDESLEDQATTHSEPVDNRMWVDKYTSLKYMDLLTDEQVNRNVLTWLKTWDEVVFPSNPKVNLKLAADIHAKQNPVRFGH